MARTRDTILALVRLNTGRTDKDTLIGYVCDSALKEAVLFSIRKKQTFRDTVTQRTWAITTGLDYVQVMGTGGGDGATPSNNDDITDIITARIIDSSSDDNKPLIIKGRQWWDKEVVNGADNVQGWPSYGIRLGNYLFFDRPSEANKVLYLRCCTIPTFTSGSTTCPIKNLDLFVEYWATAQVFHSLEQDTQYQRWMAKASGELSIALEADIDTAKDNQMIPSSTYGRTGIGIQSVTYDDEGHPILGSIVQHF